MSISSVPCISSPLSSLTILWVEYAAMLSRVKWVLQDLPGLIEAGIEHGYEGRRVRHLPQNLVEILKDRGRPAELAGAKAKRNGERRHQERSRGPVSGNVGDHHVDNIVGDLEEVI